MTLTLKDNNIILSASGSDGSVSAVGYQPTQPDHVVTKRYVDGLKSTPKVYQLPVTGQEGEILFLEADITEPLLYVNVLELKPDVSRQPIIVKTLDTKTQTCILCPANINDITPAGTNYWDTVFFGVDPTYETQSTNTKGVDIQDIIYLPKTKRYFKISRIDIEVSATNILSHSLALSPVPGYKTSYLDSDDYGGAVRKVVRQAGHYVYRGGAWQPLVRETREFFVEDATTLPHDVSVNIGDKMFVSQDIYEPMVEKIAAEPGKYQWIAMGDYAQGPSQVNAKFERPVPNEDPNTAGGFAVVDAAAWPGGDPLVSHWINIVGAYSNKHMDPSIANSENNNIYADNGGVALNTTVRAYHFVNWATTGQFVEFAAPRVYDLWRPEYSVYQTWMDYSQTLKQAQNYIDMRDVMPGQSTTKPWFNSFITPNDEWRLYKFLLAKGIYIWNGTKWNKYS